MTTLSHGGAVVSFDVGDRLKTNDGRVGTIKEIADKSPWKITLTLDNDAGEAVILQSDIEEFLT